MAVEPPPGAGVWPAAGYDQVQATIRRAIADPGAYLARGDQYREPLPSWQTRAVLAALVHAGMAITFGPASREYRLDTGAGMHRRLADHEEATEWAALAGPERVDVRHVTAWTSGLVQPGQPPADHEPAAAEDGCG